MVVIYALLAACLGAFIGKLMAITVNYLPQILLEGCDKGREPTDIFRWFFQKPFCLHCQYSTGRRALLLEMGVALLFGITALFFPIDFPLVFVWAASCLLICCCITDFEHGILPDQLTLALVWVGLLGSLYPVFVTPQEAIIGATGGYAFFWVFNAIYHYVRHLDGMYPGDFKLNAGIGACIGFQLLVPVFIVSLLLLIATAALKILCIKKESYVTFLQTEIAYACFISVTALFVIYYKLAGIYNYF